jgi:hypothetical protein
LASIVLRRGLSATIVLVFIGVFLFPGCVFFLPPRWDSATVIVTQNGDRIVFDIPEENKQAVTQLAEIMVVRLSEEVRAEEPPASKARDQVFWHAHQHIRMFKDPPVVTWPLRYGEQVANVYQQTPAEKLRPGRYSVEIWVDALAPDMRRLGRPLRATAEFSIGPDLKLGQ